MSAPIMQVNPDRQIVATIVIRRPQATGDAASRLLSGNFQASSREEAEKTLSADPQDLNTVRHFAETHGLRLVSENAPARLVRVEGSIRQMEAAFGVSMHRERDAAMQEYLSYHGDIVLPKDLQGVVEAVLGLDRRPVARTH
jgi:kumamolisin